MNFNRLLVIPLATVIAAWLGIAVWQGTPAVWSRVVHENGRLTLLQTILYVEHAAGELPVDLILGVAIGASVLRWRQPRPLTGAAGTRRARLAIAAAVGAVAVIVAGTLISKGPHTLLLTLGQFQTRDTEPAVWGSHWRYHLLERAAELLLVIAIAAAARSTRAADQTTRLAGRLLWGVLALFGLLSVIFGVTPEPFVDPRFLGHQARELLTHLLVTVPLALWVVGRWTLPGDGIPIGSARRVMMLAGASGTTLAAYVVGAAIATGARSAGQQTGLAALLLPHVFEHVLSYVAVSAVAAATFAIGAESSETERVEATRRAAR